MVDQSSKQLQDYVQEKFFSDYLEGIKEFIRIPSLSPLFDAQWQENGALKKQMQHLVDFANGQDIKGMKITPLMDEGKSPFLIVDIAASSADNDYSVLMYGHLDKQPYGEGWTSDPCDPVIKEDGKLYGRGSSDDGYAFFTALLSVKACQAQGKSHPRVIITIEGSEEGEIFDLMYYMQTYKHMLGEPNLVICLDSVAYTDKTMTITSSLRGCLNFDLKVNVTENNVHSGLGGGIVPNSFQILSILLQRVQDFTTQQMHEDFMVEIPSYRAEECAALSKQLPLLSAALPMGKDTKSIAFEHADAPNCKENYELHLNNWWRPCLQVIGIEGMPTNIENAGNVIYKELKFRMSMRLAPTHNATKVVEMLKAKFTEQKDDTFGAQVEFSVVDAGDGFSAPDLPKDVKEKFYQSTQQVFEGQEPMFVGCGGSIPFMEVFSKEFPNAQFLLTGCGFPDSNAHSANENLDIQFCNKLTAVIAVFLSQL